MADTSNGRIYRVVYKTATPFKGDISKLTDAELVKLQLHPNDFFVRRARRVLQERAASGKLAKETPDALRAVLKDEKDVPRLLRAAWALHAVGSLSDSDVQLLAAHGDAFVRANAIRLALDTEAPSKRILEVVTWLAKDESEHVRRTLAGQAHRLDGYYLAAVCDLLPKQPADPDTALMVWYAIEPQVTVADLGKLAATPNPKFAELAVRKLLSKGSERQQTLAECVAVLRKLDSEAARTTILRGMRDSLQGAKGLKAPDDWRSAYGSLLSGKDEARDLGDEISLILGDPVVLAALKARVGDASVLITARRTAVRLLAQYKVPDVAPSIQSLLDDAALRGTAIRALAGYPNANTPAALLKEYPKFTADEKADAVQTLVARTTFAKALLEAVEAGTVPRTDVPVTIARQIIALNDKATTERLEKVWGKIAPVAKERAALMKKWKDALTEDALKRADVTNGRAVFARSCASCHKMFGVGQAVGPELTGSQRSNLDYVLENVIDPSAVVPREYKLVNFTTTDDRVISGIVVSETKDAVTVRTTNEQLVLPVSDIAARKQTNLSIMPEGLFDAMKPDEVRDLVAYLRAKEQVPKPKQ